MIFQDPKQLEKLLQPVRDPDLKEEISEFYKEKRKVLKDTVLHFAHYRCILEYKEVNSNAKLSIRPVSLRVMESDVNGPLALHELSVDEKRPALLSTLLSPEVFSNLEEVIARIFKKEYYIPVGQLRHISVPALNVEALWYQRPEWNDIYFKQFGSDELIVRSENDFVTYLNELKSKFVKSRERLKGEKKGEGKRGG